jgi:hypothetical protein
LLAIYSVTVIPSADQQLLVNHLKLKGQQSLRNILRDLGWLPISARFDGKTQRIWVRQDNTVDKGRLDAPILSQDLKGAIPLGFTWWPISQAIFKGWHELTAHVLRPGRYKHTKTEKGKTTVQHELHSNPEENYARGPFADSTSDTDFESYNWKQSQKQVDDVNDLSEQDLNF